MRIDAEHEEFLSSTGPLSYLVRRLQEVESFRASTPIGALVDAAAQMELVGDKEGIDGEIKAFLKHDMGFVLTAMRRWMREASEDHRVLPQFREAIEFDSGLFYNVNLVKKRGVGVTVSSIAARDISDSPSEGTRVVFSGQKVFFKFLAADAIRLTIWECDRYGDGSEFSTLKCWKAREVVVSTGDELEIDGTYQSLSFGGCDQTAVFLQAENLLKDIGTSIAFDSATGAFLATYPTSRLAMRRMVMASALKHMGTQDRLGDLPEKAIDGPFYLRWHLLREMVAAAPERNYDLLASVAEQDESPIIRRAASATLGILARRREQNVA